MKDKKKVRSRNKLTMLLVVIVGTVFMIVFILFTLLGLSVLAFEFEGQGHVPYIQQALDNDCPHLEIEVSRHGFSSDPSPNWSSTQAYCSTDFDGNWSCHCRDIPKNF